MVDQAGKEDTVSIEDLVVSHSYEMMALITVLENKGIVTRGEIIEEIRKMRGL